MAEHVVIAEKSSSVAEVIRHACANSGRKMADIACEMGFRNQSALSMIKAGRLALPADKVLAASKVLDIDPAYLARLVAVESHPFVLHLAELIAQRPAITATEAWLIERLRQEAGGWDVDLSRRPHELAQILTAWRSAWLSQLEGLPRRIPTPIPDPTAPAPPPSQD